MEIYTDYTMYINIRRKLCWAVEHSVSVEYMPHLFQHTYPEELKQGEARVTLVNTLPCEVSLAAPWLPHNSSIATFQKQVSLLCPALTSGNCLMRETLDITLMIYHFNLSFQILPH